MIDTSKKHTYIDFEDSKVVVYFGKYNFTESAKTLKDMQDKDSPYVFTKTEILSASIVAHKFNDKYVKSSGTYDIDEGEFKKIAFSNKEILIGILTNYRHLITNKTYQKAKEIMEYLEDEFAFKILSDNLTEFENGIAKFLAEDSSLSSHVMGIAAYIPTYYETHTKKDELKERSNQTGHLAKIGEKVDTEIEILTSRYIATTQYGGSGYMVNAITTDNHRLSFFTSNEDIANSKKNIKVSCKVKALGTAWRDDSINETKVNYVKFS
jgi:hypothetical protein